MSKATERLPYRPEKLPRELKRFYISATEAEISQMLDTIKVKEREELFAHVPSAVKFDQTPDIGPSLSYDELIEHMEELAAKNRPKTSFIGDGLQDYRVHDIVPYVCNLRGLTTAYTPYQPERSQGTLHSLWIYSSTLSMLTGFEAINASMYERSTALYEALQTGLKLHRKAKKVLVCESIYPGDREVLDTLACETELEIVYVPTDKKTGLTDYTALKQLLDTNLGKVAALAFPQINHFGNLEDVHLLTDMARLNKLVSIAVIDPMTLATDGLLPPSEYGSDRAGVDIIIGEGQHLAIGPNTGGPGVGIFGIRYNDKNKTSIRSTPGRYVGKGQDETGQEALTMVLSTREQHIRREKATSNICSNQSFLATLVGAAILGRGESGMKAAATRARQAAHLMAERLTQYAGVELAFADSIFFNEFTLKLEASVGDLIRSASEHGLHLGVDISERCEGGDFFLKVSFSDKHTDQDLNQLEEFFKARFGNAGKAQRPRPIADKFLRKTPVGLPDFSLEKVKEFYQKLNDLNVSPDNNIYPLGSCTMKYNPYINDYAAGLSGFTDVHPQAPEIDIQGSLEILYHTQEMFKAITGLPGVTTQPVAGAQGELVGLKLFQAYFRDRGEKRDIVLIPRSAHGTNPATATMAGFETKRTPEGPVGIVTINPLPNGQIDLENLKNVLAEYGSRVAGIMVTNPNTSGIFESEFHVMSKLIHEAGGLVYMDGANMNAICSWVDLNKLGVDAVHNNLHKTWTIPHGGGGPGDAIVAVSERLVPYLPGIQVIKEDGLYRTVKPEKSIGSFHRHFGNFAHKVRCYTYLKALGSEGVKEIAAIAVLSARYLYQRLKKTFPTLPARGEQVPRMHEFILTLSPETFSLIEKAGIQKAQIIAKVGKLFLDYGLHAPTVAFPEQFGLMVEPTESFSKSELDHFCDIVESIHHIINHHPEVLKTAPHFTPVRKVDEVLANKQLILSETILELPGLKENPISPVELGQMPAQEVSHMILEKAQVN